MSTESHRLKDKGSPKQALLAGAVAGLFSRFCISPLDVVKIRLQLQTHVLTRGAGSLHGILPTVRTILRDEGIRGFWRGNLSAELLYVTYSACQFTTYRFLSSHAPAALPAPAAHFLAGAGAGALATTVSYPLDLLRTRFAAMGRARVYASLRASLAAIWRAEGARGLFSGLGAGVAQIVPHMGLFFGAYEALHPALLARARDARRRGGGGGSAVSEGGAHAAAGVAASVAAKAGTFPLDLVRKRLQVQGPSRARFAGGAVPAYGGGGVARTAAAVVRAEGWRGLYRGLGVSLVKAAPASAITMWTYETVMRGLLAAEARLEPA